MSAASVAGEVMEELDAAVRPADDFGEQLLEVSMGPQHPSTHGVFRMNVALDGERVMKRCV